jgi:phosphodiesterase/alkaline phosphatase D-like protein
MVPFMMTSADAPYLLHLTNLTPNTRYHVLITLEYSNRTVAHAGTVVFGTSYTQVDLGVTEFILASCNRVIEDQDTLMVEKIAKIKSEVNPITMIHLGDQVYCDNAVKYIRNTHQNGSVLWDFENVVEQFRNCYRSTWGIEEMQKILRNGMNIMIPDDHETINNVAPEHLENSSHIDYLIVNAGVKVYQEYQQALYDDVDNTGEQKWKSFVTYESLNSNTDMMFIDLRYERAYLFDPEAPLFGKNQWNFIESRLSQQNVKNLFIFSNMPVVLIPKLFAELAYWFEKDMLSTHPSVFEDTSKFLRLICSSGINVTVFAGDVHIFSDSRIIPNMQSKCSHIRQIISSGLTKKSTVLKSWHLFLFDFLGLRIWTNHFIGWDILHDHIYLSRNFIRVFQSDSSFNYSLYTDFETLTLGQKLLIFLFDHTYIALAIVFLIFLPFAIIVKLKFFSRKKAKSD